MHHQRTDYYFSDFLIFNISTSHRCFNFHAFLTWRILKGANIKVLVVIFGLNLTCARTDLNRSVLYRAVYVVWCLLRWPDRGSTNSCISRSLVSIPPVHHRAEPRAAPHCLHLPCCCCSCCGSPCSGDLVDIWRNAKFLSELQYQKWNPPH